jgi:hypothetical protein
VAVVVVCISGESTGATEEAEACAAVAVDAEEVVVVVIEAHELREYLRQKSRTTAYDKRPIHDAKI